MAQKSGYLNRTLEFHKIYEEEIIPILKSYKQQKEKADEKNRYDYLGAALCFLSLITFMLACSGSVERFYSMILVIVSVLLCLLGSSIMEPMRAELQNNELKKKLFFKKKCMSKLLRVFGNINGITIVKSLRQMKFIKRGFSRLLRIDLRMMNLLEIIMVLSFE